jgi:hypothetical protein
MMNKTSIKHDVALGFLVLITALTISAVAIYYSVAGLAAIFAAAVIPIIIMGSILEVAKLVTAVWLHRFWSQTMWWLRTYLAIAVIVLMFITSMGIFGFLSKAHVEQTSASTESVAQVTRIDGELTRQNDIIAKAETKIKSLETSGTGSDANVQSQIDKEQKRIDSAYTRIEPAIVEQQSIITSQTSLYSSQITTLDENIKLLQKYIDLGEIKKAQGMIGSKADGAFGPKTAEAFRTWQDERKQERAVLVTKIEDLSNNNLTIKDARTEIKRLRSSAEKEISNSNILINRLRKQVGSSASDKQNIDELIDVQILRIKNANIQVDTLTDEKYKIEGEYRQLEAEVGPIKYIAEFVYGGEADKNLLEEAVRWVIITIIFVFDPLAVLLLIASQYTFAWSRQREEDEGDDPSDPSPTPIPPDDEDKYEDVSDDELQDELLTEEEKASRDVMILANFGAPVGDIRDLIKPMPVDEPILYEDVSDEELLLEEDDNFDPNQLELDFDTEPSKPVHRAWEELYHEIDEPDYVEVEIDETEVEIDEDEDDPYDHLFAEIDKTDTTELVDTNETLDVNTTEETEQEINLDTDLDDITVDPRIGDLPMQGTPDEAWASPITTQTENEQQEPDDLDKVYSKAQQESANKQRTKGWLSGGFPSKE